MPDSYEQDQVGRDRRRFSMKFTVFSKSADGKVFYYTDLGSGRGQVYRLWFSPTFITREEENQYIIFPLKGEIVQGKSSSTLVLKKGQKQIYVFEIKCGFRGCSSFEVLSPSDVQVYEYKRYHSPRGNLGISTGALVLINSDEPLKIKWHKSGRLYGGPNEGIMIFYPDGKIEEIDDEMLLEISKEIAEEVGT
jgi:hypothetical protein